MTGYNSKRQAAQAKMDDDDDTQAIAYTYVYADTLLVAYQQGFSDGKRSEQRNPLTDEEISDLWCKVSNTDFVTADTHVFARAIEAAHGIKEGT